MEKDIDETR